MNFTELIDCDKLSYIIDNFADFKGIIRDSCFEDNDYNPLTMAKNMLYRCDANGTLKVKYFQKDYFGRRYAVDSISMQCLIREIRHTLADGVYVDIDMKNAHPVILSYLCRKNNFRCKYLDSYISNREKFLSSFSSRELGKKVYLALTNGGTSDYNSLKKKNKSKHLEKYRKEMLKLHDDFASLYPEKFKEYSDRKTKAGKKYNHKAGFMNTLLCDMENNILTIMHEYFGSSDKAVLCFDGIMLPKNGSYNLRKCEKAIDKKYKGINIKLDIKAFDEGLDLPKKLPKYVPPRGGLIFTDKIRPSINQLKIIENICKNIDDEFFTKTRTWKQLIMGLRNWCCCRDVYKIADKFSKSKTTKNNYTKQGVIDIWNYRKQNQKRAVSIASLIYFREGCLKRKYDNAIVGLKKKEIKPIKDKYEKTLKIFKDEHSKLQIGHHIDQLNGLEDIDNNIDITYFDSEYVTTKDGKPSVFEDLFEMENKIVMIKSHTGSGKTVFLKYVTEKLCSDSTHQMTLISLANRIILCKAHAKSFKTNFYSDVSLNDPKSWSNQDGLNGICVVLDSLVQFKYVSGDEYVLFLDETSSLLNYLTNNKSNMKKIRVKILNILALLILKAKYVFCVDADLTTPSIKFISDIVNSHATFSAEINSPVVVGYDDDILSLQKKKYVSHFKKKSIKLFVNNYNVKRCDVIDYYRVEKMIDRIVRDLLDGKRAFICSDYNVDFYENIYRKIVVHIKSIIKEKKKENRNSKEHNLLRKIKEGGFKYYSSDKGNKSDFDDIKSCEDNIIFCSPAITTGIDLNFEAVVYGIYYGNHLNANVIVQQLGRIRKPSSINLYFSHDTFRNEFDSVESLVKDAELAKMEMSKFVQLRKFGLSVESLYERFYNHSKFVNDELRLVRFHTLDILMNKGHHIKYNSKYVISSVLADINLTKEAVSNERLEEMKKYIWDDVPSGAQIKVINEMINKKSYFESYLSVKRWLATSIDDSKDNMKRWSDFMPHTLKSFDNKVLQMRNLMNLLGIEHLKDVNYIADVNTLTKSKIKIPISHLCKKAFRLRGKIYETDLTLLDAHKLVLDMCKSLFPHYVSQKHIHIGKDKNRRDIHANSLDYCSIAKNIKLFTRDKMDFSKNIFEKD